MEKTATEKHTEREELKERCINEIVNLSTKDMIKFTNLMREETQKNSKANKK